MTNDKKIHFHVKIGENILGNDLPLVIIAGPCQIESKDHALETAQALKEIGDQTGLSIIYKSSFDKANRTSVSGKRGLGLEKSLQVFSEIKSKLKMSTLTDVHEKEQCKPVSEVVDILQIPAFLCRQTDLLIAAGETGTVVNC